LTAQAREKHWRGDSKPSMKLDNDRLVYADRQHVRRRLREIMRPILDERITPFVRQAYPGWCEGSSEEARTKSELKRKSQKKRRRGSASKEEHKNDGDQDEEGAEGGEEDEDSRNSGAWSLRRECSPCYSLVRRYRPFERTTHAMHHDGHALVTVVVSLSDYGDEYTGGLFVSDTRSARLFFPLRRGDGVTHTSHLLHGVSVGPRQDHDGCMGADRNRSKSRNNGPRSLQRWSWIIWYSDAGPTCTVSPRSE
jgi:hypothetical protein